jgi:hypothetical protein
MRHKILPDFNVADKNIGSYKFNFFHLPRRMFESFQLEA